MSDERRLYSEPYDPAVTNGWLAEDRDAWTRRILHRHFHSDTGSPYWLRRSMELDFDPLEITTFDELARFGTFPIDDLRTLDPTTLVPRQVPRPLTGRIWETGGTTGKPCRLFLTDATIHDRGIWKRWTLARDGFQHGRNWLQATPSGPHIVGNSISEVTDQYPYASLVYTIDMDPRWVKRLIRNGNLLTANEYTEHLVGQIVDILQVQEVHYLCTTPALFSVLVANHRDEVARLEGIQLVGTRVTPDMYAEFVEALGEGIVSLWYGNTLFGIAPSLPPDNDREMPPPYVPPYPHVHLTVVDKGDWTKPVAYGQVGQVGVTILMDDLFLPNILDRDQAVRCDTGGRWPSDGVAHVAPLWNTPEMPEGVY